ncbi:MAG: FprA family A-type flavoprotein, partial [Roseburia sp.]|nr:FprA family A-type flavoprotein [Roseburia sp.]
VVMAYDTKDHVLFSADAFGRFGGLGYGEEYWDTEGRRYYTNIVGKYGSQVQNLLKKIGGTQIDMIASLHGPVLSKNLDHYFRLYNLWSTYTPELPEGVLVAYASIYGGTAAAALNAAELIGMKGVEVATVDLCRQDASIAIAQAFRMGRMLLASVTYDASLFPAMNNFLYRLASKGLSGRRVALIENGTWAPVAAKLMRDRLSAMKDMEIVETTLTIRSRLHDADRPQLDALIAALTA